MKDLSLIVFAGLAILLVRPLSVLSALCRSRLEYRLRLVAAWFGPKGFASMLFSLLAFHRGGARRALVAGRRAGALSRGQR